MTGRLWIKDPQVGAPGLGAKVRNRHPQLQPRKPEPAEGGTSWERALFPGETEQAEPWPGSREAWRARPECEGRRTLSRALGPEGTGVVLGPALRPSACWPVPPSAPSRALPGAARDGGASSSPGHSVGGHLLSDGPRVPDALTRLGLWSLQVASPSPHLGVYPQASSPPASVVCILGDPSRQNPELSHPAGTGPQDPSGWKVADLESPRVLGIVHTCVLRLCPHPDRLVPHLWPRAWGWFWGSEPWPLAPEGTRIAQAPCRPPTSPVQGCAAGTLRGVKVADGESPGDSR